MILVRIAAAVVLGYLAWTHPHTALLIAGGALFGPFVVRWIQGG